MVFSTVLGLVRTKNIKCIRDTFLQLQKRTDQLGHSESAVPILWEGVLARLLGKTSKHWHPRKGGI